MYIYIPNTNMVIEQPSVEKRTTLTEKNRRVISEDIAEIRREILNFKLETEDELRDFFSYPVNPLNYPHLYAYYYLTDASDLAKDYFPPEINAEFLPYLEKVEREILPLAKEEYLQLPSLNVEIYNYIQNTDKGIKTEKIFKDYTKQAILFDRNVERYLSKFQKLESEYFLKVLTPMPPKDKEIIYLSSALRLYPKATDDLSFAIKVFLDYYKRGEIKPSPLEEYKFYINVLSVGGY